MQYALTLTPFGFRRNPNAALATVPSSNASDSIVPLLRVSIFRRELTGETLSTLIGTIHLATVTLSPCRGHGRDCDVDGHLYSPPVKDLQVTALYQLRQLFGRPLPDSGVAFEICGRRAWGNIICPPMV